MLHRFVLGGSGLVAQVNVRPMDPQVAARKEKREARLAAEAAQQLEVWWNAGPPTTWVAIYAVGICHIHVDIYAIYTVYMLYTV